MTGDKLTGRTGGAQSSHSTGPQAQATTTAATWDATPRSAPDAARVPRDLGAVLAELGLSLDEGSTEPTVTLAASALRATAQALRDCGFMLLDSVGIDYLKFPALKPARFALLHNLYHPHEHLRVFLRVWLEAPAREVEGGQDELPVVDSLYPVWKAANYLEREVYDLMGFEFRGHPDLRKVLTPDDLEGHPLRKDFPLGETPTRFNEGRFIDPPTFRAGLSGQNPGLTGYRGELRRGEGEGRLPPVMPQGGPK